jgi:hypothetical protein
MIQTNWQQAADPASLEGLDDLLDGVFAPPVSSNLTKRSIEWHSGLAPNLVAPNADNRIRPERRTPRLARFSSTDSTALDSKPSYDELKGQVSLLTARLAYALEALSEAKSQQAVLRTQVAALKDQLRLMPELLNKALRLRELESGLARLIRRAMDLV